MKVSTVKWLLVTLLILPMTSLGNPTTKNSEAPLKPLNAIYIRECIKQVTLSTDAAKKICACTYNAILEKAPREMIKNYIFNLIPEESQHELLPNPQLKVLDSSETEPLFEFEHKIKAVCLAKQTTKTNPTQ